MRSASAAETAAEWCLHLSAGDLSEAQQQALARWLDADPEHARLLERARQAWHAVGAAAEHPRMQALRRAAREDAARSRRRHRAGYALAAAACLALVGLGLWWRLAPEVYRTDLAERRTVVLDDGSRVTLDADTRLEVRYGEQLRQLRLRQGRAAFEVAKQPARPFVVRADDTRVIATGTQFSVERLAGEVRVVLYEGSVEVERARTGSASLRSMQRLTPGQAWTGGPRKQGGQVARIDAGQEQAWRDGLLVFHDEPLDLAIARVNRYSKMKLELGEANLAELRISGMFKAGDSAAFVSGVTALLPLHARSGGDTTVLERR
ncbi:MULTISPECIES: FecR family protein [Gammaproteobacteria]|uniref:FecR family protein n=1 Tax=Xanthomonas boreopolis TaxID=86183 RepID=A0A919FAN0_9XANT|nr:FecR domain-containing protein [Pseudomonas sp. Hp2]GHH59126.1 hypothetical protein GCM10009090_32790 [[Pseudomonas] boreopolis]